MRMRVRSFWLRVIAVPIAVLWGATTVALVFGYRPGGPVDGAVAIGPLIATAAGVAAIAWPPVSRDRSAATAVAWVGILTALVLAPSFANVAGTVLAGQAWRSGAPAAYSPFLPSPEAAYAWFLALAGTGVYSGVGAARRFVRAPDLRRSRIALEIVIAIAILGASAGISGVAALANELALTGEPAQSEWGPADPTMVPPPCTSAVRAGMSARVSVDGALIVDERVVRRARQDGVRSGRNEAWDGSISPWSSVEPGAPAASAATAAPQLRRSWIAVDGRAWVRGWTDSETGGAGWTAANRPPAPTLDTAVVDGILTERARLAAEDLGIELVGGAPARHCRLLVDGPVALAAFQPLAWLAGGGEADGQAESGPAATAADRLIGTWRGDLDWWVFADGELGLARVRVGGPVPGEWPVDGVMAVAEATLSATDRSSAQQIRPPEEAPVSPPGQTPSP